MLVMLLLFVCVLIVVCFFFDFLVSVRTVHLKQKTSVYENVFCLGKRQIKEVKVCASVTEENPG